MPGNTTNISNNGSDELPDRVSSDLWTGLPRKFKRLSGNFAPNNNTTESTYIVREQSHIETEKFFNSTTSSQILESIGWTSLRMTNEGISIGPSRLEVQATTKPNETTASPPTSMYPHHYPLFYDAEECHKLNYTSDPLYMCEKNGLVFGFGLFFVLVGIIAILGNCVLPIVVWRQKNMRTRQNYIKVSLAFNDIISGFILIFSLPNMIWFRNHPESQVIDVVMKAANSPVAIVAGSCLLISLQGSLFHLMFLSADRFIAIKWPMWNRFRRKSTVMWTLFGIWVLTIAGSVLPALFPKYFIYTFNYPVFIYTMAYKFNTASRIHGQLHFGLALFFPYVATIILIILTGTVALKELKRFKKSRNYIYYEENRSKMSLSEPSNGSKSIPQDSGRSEKGQKPALAVVKTVLIMTGAFIIAWSIFFEAYFLTYNGHLNDEKEKKIVYMISFYSGLSNSVANVIIYSVRDNRFRAAVSATFWPERIVKQRQCSTGSKNLSERRCFRC